jgi:predicted transcriptional regulator
MNMFEARSLMCSKDVTVEQVMHCLLGVRELEIEVYSFLLQKPGTPDEIAKRLGKSRSLVQRALQNLLGFGMAYRKPVKRTRGRAFEYEAVPKEEVKELLRKSLASWTKSVGASIDDW